MRAVLPAPSLGFCVRRCGACKVGSDAVGRSCLFSAVPPGENDVMELSEINQRLVSFYRSIWGALVQDLAGYGALSSPLLIEVPPPYTQGAHRLLVVGQETYGWRNGLWKRIQAAAGEVADPVAELLGTYWGFERGRHYRPSPFWRCAHQMQRLLNPGVDPFGFLWSNLLKVDQDHDRPSRAVEDAILRQRMLPKEVELAAPSVVIFFTGPDYDGVLQKIFPDAALEPVPHERPRLLARVRHEALPLHSYRTYHPGYLVRARKRHILQTVADLIRAAPS